MKFTSDVNGLIKGIRFYKGAANTGTHIGSLWIATGTLLAPATFTGETASGWQQVNFATPVAITADTDLRRLVLRARPGTTRQTAASFAARASTTRPCTRRRRRRQRRQRRLPVRHRQRVPEPHLQLRELLGRRRVLHRAGDRAHGADRCDRDGRCRLGAGELDRALRRRQPDHELHGHAVHRGDRADTDHRDREPTRHQHHRHRADHGTAYTFTVTATNARRHRTRLRRRRTDHADRTDRARRPDRRHRDGRQRIGAR